MTLFDNFITSDGLLDFNILGVNFTWSNNLASHPKMSKLDCFLSSGVWDSVFPKTLVKALPQLASDHVPILMDMDGEVYGPIPFRFELMWLEDNLLLEVV
ncbi:hypothetical protein AMTRI_Chr11g151850 [Amborella trichopoda]